MATPSSTALHSGRIQKVFACVAGEGSFASVSDLKVDHCGYNAQGNYYESYMDGSFHYSNQVGSTYDCDADEHATYTSPSGEAHDYGEQENAGEGNYADDGGYGNNCDYAGGGYSDGGGSAYETHACACKSTHKSRIKRPRPPSG